MPIPAIEFRGVSFARPGQVRVFDNFTLTVDAPPAFTSPADVFRNRFDKQC